VHEYGLHVMDASLPVEVQQKQMRRVIKPFLATMGKEAAAHAAL
jgi:hypothetical protein